MVWYVTFAVIRSRHMAQWVWRRQDATPPHPKPTVVVEVPVVEVDVAVCEVAVLLVTTTAVAWAAVVDTPARASSWPTAATRVIVAWHRWPPKPKQVINTTHIAFLRFCVARFPLG